MLIAPPALCLIRRRCTRGEPCKGFDLELAVRRWRWRRRAKSRRRSKSPSAGPTAMSRSSPITTTGDKVTRTGRWRRSAARACGRRSSTRALLAGEVDFCVHSMKDVESDPARRKSTSPRSARAATSVTGLSAPNSIEELKQGAIVGTSSPRRKAQLLRLRPDLKIVPIRGNVETRLRKVEAGEVDATLLAAAGLKRLGIERRHRDPDRNHPSGAWPSGHRDGVPHQRHANPKRADDRQQRDHL